jgi:hypothetical protein
MLDGYENPNPTTPPPEEKRDKPLVRPIPVISQRILNNIEDLERIGETARHASFVVTPARGIWRKMGNKTFYRLFGLHYVQHSNEKNGLQESIDTAKSRVFIKDASYTCTTALTLKPGIGLEGESMPQLTNVDPIAPENITFTTNANSDTGTVLTTTGNNDCFTGTLLRTVSVQNMGLANFTNGFNLGAANVLGISNSNFSRIFYSNVATPLKLINFQMLRLDQHYAWLPTTNFIFAQNNNANWFGGNSYWTDLFAHGCKNVNGAVTLLATAGGLNLIEAHRLQVNMQDSSFVNSTSGYGLYLQGLANTTALCANNTFIALNIEGTPLKAVRLEDFSYYNYIHIALDNLSGGGFDFSLKKNATAQAPIFNMLVYSNTTAVAVESDNFQNFLMTAGNLTPVTGAYPAGMLGVGVANFGGTSFPTFFGGGAGQSMVGASTNGVFTAQTAPKTVATFQVPVAENMEIGVDLAVSAYTSGTIQVQVSFTDRYNNARTIILPVISPSTNLPVTGATATGYWPTPTTTISSIPNTIVTVSTIGTFVATYGVSAFLRASA